MSNPRLTELESAICLVEPTDPFAVVASELRPWRGITFHHSFIPTIPVWRVDYARAFNRFHFIKNKWDLGLGYHLLVTWNPDNHEEHRCQASYRWVHQCDGAHARNILNFTVDGELIQPNQQTIGICLVGNFEVICPTQESYRYLELLCSTLCGKLNIQHQWFFRHDQFTHKICPGKQFNEQNIVAYL